MKVALPSPPKESFPAITSDKDYEALDEFLLTSEPLITNSFIHDVFCKYVTPDDLKKYQAMNEEYVQLFGAT